MSNQVAKVPTIGAFINAPSTQQSIMNTLGDMSKTKKFTTAIVSATQTNPALKECMPASILTAALIGEGLGLNPSPQMGHYYLVPYGNKNNPQRTDANGNVIKNKNGYAEHYKDAQFQLGYKGYIQLALRSGQYEDLDVLEIREGEYKGKDRITGKASIEFIENDDVRENLPVVGYYAYLKLKTGFIKTIYWSKEKMLNHANTYSSAFSKEKYADLIAGKIPQKDMWQYSSFWYKDFDQMAFKTLLRNIISKWGIMSIELIDAVENDMKVYDEKGNGTYADNQETKHTDIIDVKQEQEEKVATKEMPTEELKEEKVAQEPTVNSVDMSQFD